MADAGHLETEALIRSVQEKVEREYQKAAEEVYAKTVAYWQRFEAKDAQWQKWVADGTKSAKEYRDWQTGQLMIGTRWEDLKDSLAADYHNANVIARSTVDGYTPEAYAINHNYGTFQVERASMMDTSYTLYDRSTVERLMREDPDLLPAPSSDLASKIAANKDLKWQEGQIQSITTQSILQGSSIPEMAKRISETLATRNYSSCMAYARTSMTAAQNAGRQDAYERAEAMGIEMQKMWIATLDDRTRDAHRELDGQTVPVDEPFEVDGEKLMYPADPSADPSLVWNCRCTTIVQLKGFERDPTDLGLRSDEKLGDMTYAEWKEGHKHKEEEAPAKSPEPDNIPEPAPANEPEAVPAVEREIEQMVSAGEYDELIANAREFSPEEHEDMQGGRARLETLPMDEQRALEHYTGDAYEPINNSLRGIPSIEDGDYTAVIESMTNAINGYEIKEDTVLYRGAFSAGTGAKTFGVTTEQFEAMIKDGSIVGQTFADLGFCSTSVSQAGVIPKDINLRIYAPAGTKGCYVAPISHFSRENEMLLQRGTTFEVVGTYRQSLPQAGGVQQFLDVVIVGQPTA